VINLVTVVGHQFITLTIHICVEDGEREAPRYAGLSAAAETCTFHVFWLGWSSYKGDAW